MEMTIEQKLVLIQQEIKVVKSQYSAFGDYYFRSVEDIQEALKPLALQYDCVCVCSDELVMVGDRYYIKATARLIDCINGKSIEATAYAREELEKKKLDGSQVTGVSSSYARKYALGGLLQLDDNKDSDGLPKDDKDDKKPKQDKPFETNPKKPKMTLDEAKNYQFVSRGTTYTVGELEDSQLVALKDTKLPELRESVNVVLENRAKKAYGKGDN